MVNVKVGLALTGICGPHTRSTFLLAPQASCRNPPTTFRTCSSTMSADWPMDHVVFERTFCRPPCVHKCHAPLRWKASTGFSRLQQRHTFETLSAGCRGRNGRPGFICRHLSRARLRSHSLHHAWWPSNDRALLWNASNGFSTAHFVQRFEAIKEPCQCCRRQPMARTSGRYPRRSAHGRSGRVRCSRRWP